MQYISLHSLQLCSFTCAPQLQLCSFTCAPQLQLCSFTCAPQVLGSASSVISLAGKLLVSRIQELALWNTFPEALQQLSSGLGKKIDMDETPTRFTDTIEVSKVDQPKLMFKVNQLVVLSGLSVYRGGASTREVSLTIRQVSDGGCAPNCV